ncbi:hypothetical protein PUNSTDRAFT_136409 [Punctularia strigosozonata HHB-11173 SS5]|uniref:uncharacterized protein n=1 Tax=Punctularia strigosozonata (strain HHB-11173) TaxID=741275 RepID=UPI000441698F|nr:uncharacterized protein PUNSTDRAFT_136409 [Punctularia strigosozonata HHB-11173 SS5]EIN06556.1 hypothetical protein PUNSTDRAFT_136409 [Punctularia strigosozonata HHB-11173 SS5]
MNTPAPQAGEAIATSVTTVTSLTTDARVELTTDTVAFTIFSTFPSPAVTTSRFTEGRHAELTTSLGKESVSTEIPASTAAKASMTTTSTTTASLVLVATSAETSSTISTMVSPGTASVIPTAISTITSSASTVPGPSSVHTIDGNREGQQMIDAGIIAGGVAGGFIIFLSLVIAFRRYRKRRMSQTLSRRRSGPPGDDRPHPLPLPATAWSAPERARRCSRKRSLFTAPICALSRRLSAARNAPSGAQRAERPPDKASLAPPENAPRTSIRSAVSMLLSLFQRSSEDRDSARDLDPALIEALQRTVERYHASRTSAEEDDEQPPPSYIEAVSRRVSSQFSS